MELEGKGWCGISEVFFYLSDQPDCAVLALQALGDLEGEALGAGEKNRMRFQSFASKLQARQFLCLIKTKSPKELSRQEDIFLCNYTLWSKKMSAKT